MTRETKRTAQRNQNGHDSSSALDAIAHIPVADAASRR